MPVKKKGGKGVRKPDGRYCDQCFLKIAMAEERVSLKDKDFHLTCFKLWLMKKLTRKE